MDRVEHYRCLLMQFLQEQADLMNSHPVPGLETLCVFDATRDEYMVYNVGWEHGRRVHYVTLLARLRGGKVWIEEDGTEEGLATLLVEAGVPKEDIVLAFIAPEMRPLSDFAAA